MRLWRNPKFRVPTNAVGDWHVVRTLLFEHENAPTAMKWTIEKMTVQLLRREAMEGDVLTLRYSGTSSAGGHPITVRLELIAAGDGKYLYELCSESTAPKRWENEDAFIAACDRRFNHWGAQLNVVKDLATWPHAARETLARLVVETVAKEEAAARVIEDPAPVRDIQRQVLQALRAGSGFSTAHKEGGTRLFFDGNVYRRTDYGEEPNLCEVYADDQGMLNALRLFYSWDAQRAAYPHPKPELAIWRYIQEQLRPR